MYQIVVSMTLYIVVLYYVSYEFICPLMVYILVLAVQSLELNSDFIHIYYWKFDLFFEYMTPRRHFLDLG